ncbi:DUF3710 domain-containing protein [uncultured Nocardioides sp.]|uniref:DUF3710 domain-containing protein n=1 Tax=uncultured Nocardioides sp. TaxID=198441 RepID=UPI00260D08F9|nr:DUF3710 domain-containing protein [uncultured Nocardioides sp.]
MKFRRKAQSEPVEDDGSLEADDPEEETAADLLADGPFDSEDLPPLADGERVDLGSLLITPEPNRELRLQVDEASGAVQQVLLAGPDGALEVRAFAAPRNGDLWSEVRPQIAAEVAQSGGTATEREGPWGTELICQVGQRSGAPQVTRVLGINGPRWMLRCSLLGAGAARPDESGDWEDSIRRLGVHRGSHAMPVGEALPVVMPPQARRVEQNS